MGFYASSITSLKLPDSVEEIDSYAFYKAFSLSGTVTMPPKLRVLGEYSFYECGKLQEVIFPSNIRNLTEIEAYTFDQCRALKQISIPEGVEIINPYAFEGCSLLEILKLPSSLNSIKSCAFSQCTSLRSISIPERVESIGKQAFYNCSALEEIRIPERVESIGDLAFYNCSALEEIRIEDGNNLITIGKNAFYGSSSAQARNLYIGRDFSVNGTNCFGVKLTELKFGEFVTSIPDNTFKDSGGSITIPVLSIPSSIHTIGDYAFGDLIFNTIEFYSDSLNIGSRAIRVPISMKFNDAVGEISIKDDSFFFLGTASGDYDLYIGCNLKLIGTTSPLRYFNSIYLGPKVTTIPDYIFSGCTRLSTIEIPETVSYIGKNAFYGCKNLYSVTIGKGCTSIGADAFTGCTTLTSVTSLNSIPPSILGKTFESSTTANGRLIVPFGSKNRYLTSDYWLEFVDVIELEESGDGNGTPGTVYEDIAAFIYMKPDESKDFSAQVESEEATLTWTSSNEDIAEVNKKGRVDAWGFGRCYITAKNADDEIIAVFEVFVCPTVSIHYGSGKSYQHHVIYNSTPNLFIAAPEGYEITSVSHDGEDVTAIVKSNNGIYTPAVPITDNSTITVSLNNTAIPGDLNGDGKVDSSDLNWLLEQIMNF